MHHTLLRRIRAEYLGMPRVRMALERARRFCNVGIWWKARMSSTASAVVLLVQPERDDRDMYAAFLRCHGFLPIPVSTARDALTAASKTDVIVTDILLPGDMDGIELVARLKADALTKRTPIIVLTACAWTSDRERAAQAGCDVFLPKPCVRDDLLREMRRLLTVSTTRDARGASTKGDLPNEPLDRREVAADVEGLRPPH